MTKSELSTRQDEDLDGQLGMAWWNALSERDRQYWCFAAMTSAPSVALRYFKSVTRYDERQVVGMA